MSGRSLALAAAAVILGLVFALLLGEGVLRLFRPASESIENLPANHPARCLDKSVADRLPRFKPGCRIPGLNINRLGFRGPEPPADLGAVRRVMVLGESVAFGWGASSDDTTFAGVLQDLLGPSYCVLNAGIPSRTLGQTIRFYDEYASRFDPQIIVLFCGWNDLTNATYHPAKVAAWLARQPYRPALLDDPLNFFLERSRLALALYLYGVRPLLVWRNELQSYNEELVAAYHAELAAFVRRETGQGRKVFLLTLPTYLRADMGFVEFNRAIKGGYVLGIYATPRTCKHLHEVFNSIIRQAASAPGAMLVDLDRLFQRLPAAERPRFFAGEAVHLNDAGNALIARELYRAIRRVDGLAVPSQEP